MNEYAKQKLADFLDKEVADKEIVIADLIDKVYDFAVSVERERCLNFVNFGISRSVTPTEYLQAMEIVYRAMIYVVGNLMTNIPHRKTKNKLSLRFKNNI